MAAQARAQDKPWVLFLDDQSSSRCDLVNADNAELVVLQGTGQMRIVSATDVTFSDLIVDTQGFVSFEGEPAGVIDFSEDGDGFRSLWWMSLTGNVIRVNELTGAPTVTNRSPEDSRSVPCDACEFWDDPADCPDPLPPIPPLCGPGVPAVGTLMLSGLMAVRLRRRGPAP